MKNLMYSLTILVAFGLVGCGGGSASSNTSSSIEQNQAVGTVTNGNTATKNTVSLNDLPPVPQIPADN